MSLEFEVRDQVLKRIDNRDIVSNNKNVYSCKFTFTDSAWDELNKFAIFTDGWGESYKIHLGKDSNVLSCILPAEVLQGTNFKIAVYGGNLISTNSIRVDLISSGYTEKSSNTHNKCGHDNKDIFVEIFDRLDETVTSIAFSNDYLHLFNGEKLIESVYLPYTDEEDVNELIGIFADEIQTELNNKADINHRHDNASSTTDGFLSSEDKIKLDNIESGANKTIVDDVLSICSENPVQNKIITNALNGKKDDFDLIDEMDEIIRNLIISEE